MSTEIQASQTTALSTTDWEAKLAGMARDESAKVGANGQFISFKSGILSIGQNAVPKNELPCVVIATVDENLYYEDKYDPDSPKSPVCFAFGEEGEEMVPHPKAQSPQAESCGACPHNKWGSADSGRGKACKNSMRLALVPESAKESVEAMLGAEVVFAKLPVTSVKNWRTHVQKVAAVFKRPSFGVVTKLFTKPDIKTQFKVMFEPMTVIPVTVIPAIMEKQALVMDTMCVPYEPNSEEAAPKKEAKGGKKF